MNDTVVTMNLRNVDVEALQARYALRVAARLSAAAESSSHDVTERLRFAREQALMQARARRAALAAPRATDATFNGGSTLAFGGGPKPSSPRWAGFAWLLPLLVLVVGLMVIHHQHLRAQVMTAAEIDFDLLVDDLPPSAYGDQGFLEFLKAPLD